MESKKSTKKAAKTWVLVPTALRGQGNAVSFKSRHEARVYRDEAQANGTTLNGPYKVTEAPTL